VPVVRPHEADAPSLGLVPDPVSLPPLMLEADWKQQPRLWGHAFHPMCSYLASFPAALAHAFISRWSRPGDVVLDPFSGRGTVPLQACVERRIGVGVDLNPLAYLLTAAKVDPPSHGAAVSRLERLRIDWTRAAPHWLKLARGAQAAPAHAVALAPRGGSHAMEGLPPTVAVAFHERTLAQLLYLRHSLRSDDRVDRFLTAATAGILHGRSRGYLSTAMPNAFSLAPAYTDRFLAARGHRPPDRDLFALLAGKLDRLFRDGVPPMPGVALEADARTAGPTIRRLLRARSQPDRARLVVTSPPYLRVVRYGAYNWLRLWFLGRDPAGVDLDLLAPRGLDGYVRFLAEVLHGLRDALTDDAVVVVVIGDVESDRGRPIRATRPLAESVWALAAEPAGYRPVGIASDVVAAHRKVTRMWGREAGRATQTDRFLIIAPTELGRRRALSSVDAPLEWQQPSALPGRPGRPSILAPYAADVPPRRPGVDGSPGPDEEPRSRPDDQPPVELHPPATGAPLRP
jgi:hypothetical protein